MAIEIGDQAPRFALPDGRGNTAAAFADKLGVDFPLLADWPNNETIKAYGTYNEERHFSERRTFVVDRAGTVRAIIDERDASRRPAEALRALQDLDGSAYVHLRP